MHAFASELVLVLVLCDAKSAADPKHAQAFARLSVLVLCVRPKHHFVLQLPLHRHLVLFVPISHLCSASLFSGLGLGLWENFGEFRLAWSGNFGITRQDLLFESLTLAAIESRPARIHPSRYRCLRCKHPHNLDLVGLRSFEYHGRLAEVPSVQPERAR